MRPPVPVTRMGPVPWRRWALVGLVGSLVMAICAGVALGGGAPAPGTGGGDGAGGIVVGAGAGVSLEPPDDPFGVAGATAQTDGGFETHTVEGRDYLAYVPSGAPPAGGYPVVVMLHGCGQDPQGFDTATGMSSVAEAEDFVVVYPEQTNEHNAFACWNWFEPANYERGAGEARLIAGMTHDALRRYETDRSRVYIAGLSAGAAMATNVAGEYPDLYAALGSHSGLEYHAVEDPNKAVGAQQSGGLDPRSRAERAYRRAGDRTRPLPTMVIQGTGDAQVNEVNGNQTVAWAVHLADLASDDQDDGDVDLEPESRERATTADGMTYHRLRYALDGRTVVEYVLLAGARHGWSGGDPGKEYTVPEGPEASWLLWDFFADQTHSNPTFEGPGPSPTTAAPTTTVTTTAPADGDGGPTTATPGSATTTGESPTTASPTRTEPATTDGSGAGFGAVAALAAVVAGLAALAVTHRYSRR